jgi:adenylate cyclase
VWINLGKCFTRLHDMPFGGPDRGFDELGKQSLKNIAEPVEAYRVGMRPKPAERSDPLPAPARPSIAVLPFDNLSGDSGQKYLSDGLTEDIITELTRFKSLSVMGRHTSFHLAGKGLNPVQAARQLGANFVVEGSMRKAGDRIRITAQLLDAETGNHIWADRYDRESRDVFAVQDEVVGAIVATLEGRMVAAAAADARKRPTSSWTAYDFFLKGRELSDASQEREAVPYFAEATRIDPGFALAHAYLAMMLLGTFWFDADAKTLADASRAAQAALVLDSNHPSVHHANGMVMLWLRRWERSGLHFDRAISLNPMDTRIRADRAHLLRFQGQFEDALTVIDEELRRNPYPPIWFWRVRGGILFDLRRYGEAIETFGDTPHHRAFVQLAAAHGHLGNLAAAAQMLEWAREQRPSLSLNEVAAVFPYAHQEAVEHLLEGLKNAGLIA